jgi:signal transduction histidine kinase
MGAAGKLEPQQNNFLQVVKSNAERLSILVNDLLDVSRIEAGKISLLLQSLDMRSIVEEVISTISRRMEDEKRIMKLVRDIPVDIPPIYGDRDRVLQVMETPHAY